MLRVGEGCNCYTLHCHSQWSDHHNFRKAVIIRPLIILGEVCHSIVLLLLLLLRIPLLARVGRKGGGLPRRRSRHLWQLGVALLELGKKVVK